jgi:hypothetical protein
MDYSSFQYACIRNANRHDDRSAWRVAPNRILRARVVVQHCIALAVRELGETLVFYNGN